MNHKARRHDDDETTLHCWMIRMRWSAWKTEVTSDFNISAFEMIEDFNAMLSAETFMSQLISLKKCCDGETSVMGQ